MGLLHYQAGRDGLEVFSTRPESFRRKYHLNQLYLDYDDFRRPISSSSTSTRRPPSARSWRCSRARPVPR